MSTTRNLKSFAPVAAILAAAVCFAGEPAPDGAEKPAPKAQPRASTGLGIGPGMIVISNIPLGKELDPNLEFEVHNHAAIARTVAVKVMLPQESGIVGWEKGYEAIPSASWCRMEKEEIEVPANGTAKVKGLVNIPDKPENYNRKFMAAVICELKPPKGSKGSGINLRMVSRWGIETVAKDDVDGKGAGRIGMIPSVLRKDNVAAGTSYDVTMKFRNNSAEAVTFTPKRLTEVEMDSEKHARYFGMGREPILNSTWFEKLEKITIAPNETKEVKVKVNVPKDAAPDKVYEELLFLEDEAKRYEFVRVRTAIAK